MGSTRDDPQRFFALQPAIGILVERNDLRVVAADD
jgi:hypothetical protein